MRVLIVLFAFLFPLLGWTGSRMGNGGNGLLIDGKPYLLDLVEAGVEEKPFFLPWVVNDPRISERVRANLPDFPQIHDRLSQKLTEIQSFSPPIAWAITESFRFLSVRLVDQSLVNTSDSDSSLDYGKDALIQLAVRRGAAIFLNKKWWARLSTDQKVALLIHESVYAFQNTVDQPDSEQKSIPARTIVGYLFSPRMQDGTQGLAKLLYHQNRLEKLLFLLGGVQSLEAGLVSSLFKMDMLTTVALDKANQPIGMVGFITKNASVSEIDECCRQTKSYDLGYTIQAGALITWDINPNLGLQIRLLSLPHDSNCRGSLQAASRFIKE